MLKLKKVAITGGLSAGKTTVCQLLKKLGAFTISADEIVHKLLVPQSDIGNKIIQLLGDQVVKEGQFDRKKIAKIVFGDKQTLKALEKILHPVVLSEIEKKYDEVKKEAKYPLFVAEIPLLYEIQAENQFDAIIVVISDEKICKNRSRLDEEFEKRMNRQMSQEEKQIKADYTITNNQDLKSLENQVEILYKNLTK